MIWARSDSILLGFCREAVVKRGGSEIRRVPGERGRVARRPLPFPGMSLRMYEGGGEAMILQKDERKGNGE